MQTVNVIGTKGGVGSTVVATALALELAKSSGRGSVGVIGYQQDDLCAAFGCGTKTDQLTPDIAYGHGVDITVVDYGTGNLENLQPGFTVLVTRGCYLALRRVVKGDRKIPTPDLVVLIAEPGRALERGEVGKVLEASNLVTIPWDADIARAVDAGVLTARMPHKLALPVANIVRDSGLLRRTQPVG